MYDYKAVVTKVIDGATIEVQIDLGFSLYHIVKVKLYGVDVHDIRSHDLDEKSLASSEKDFLSNLVLDKIIKINTLRKNKYGVWLSAITLDNGVILNDLMIHHLNCKKEGYHGTS